MTDFLQGVQLPAGADKCETIAKNDIWAVSKDRQRHTARAPYGAFLVSKGFTFIIHTSSPCIQPAFILMGNC